MGDCCVAAFVAVHNNAEEPHCQMRVMQMPLAEPRKRANPPRFRLACRRRLPQSPAAMPHELPRCPERHPRPPSVRAATGLLLIWLSAVVCAAEPELTATGAAIATGSDLLETEIVVEKLQPADPPQRPVARFVPAGRLEAGDEVHYTIRLRNPGKNPVTDVQVTKRMPFGLHYLPGSATGPACDIEFSADGGKTFAAKPQDGDYTHVRWSMRQPLPPSSTALLRFRATFR